MAQAIEEWEQGDIRQASEKAWGAAAVRRGWQHNNHPSLYVVADRLAGEVGDDDISTLFRAASALHINFYENWLDAEGVERGLRDVDRFLDKIEPLF